MRKAFYYDSAIPPEKWLRLASLLWDEIWISPFVGNLLSSLDSFDELQGTFLASLYQADRSIFDATNLDASKNIAETILKDEKLTLFKRTLLQYTEQTTNLDITIASANSITRLLEQAKEIASRGNIKAANNLLTELKQRTKAYKATMIEKADYFNRAFFNSAFKELYPQLDYFFDKERSLYEYYSSEKEVMLIGVDAFLPRNVNVLTINQIIDFRGVTKTQRLQFRKAGENVLKDIMLSASERDFFSAVERLKDIMNEELDKSRKAYQVCKIEAVQKGMTVFTVSSALSLLPSVLGLGIFLPAALLSGAAFSSARGLAAFDKDRSEILTSPWGYLLFLRKLE